MGSHRSVLTRIVFFLLKPGKQSGGAARLRRLTGGVSLRLGHGEGMERKQNGLGKRWCSSSAHSRVTATSGGTRASSPAAGSLRSTTDRSFQATVHPGEHGIVAAVFWGASGWKESAGEVLRRGNRAEASAAREGSIPVRGCLPGLKTVV